MSADRRIREDMLMVTDTGRVSLSDFEILVYDGSGNSPLDTIDIYDEENDDYLIGGRLRVRKSTYFKRYRNMQAIL